MIRKCLTYDKSSNICYGQIEEIHIGGRPHVLVGQDHDAGGEVAQYSNDKENTVDDGEEEERFIVDMGVPEHFLDEHRNIFFFRCI